MEDRSRVLTAACVGAVLGGVWGWLYMTTSGPQVRDRIESTFDSLVDGIREARAAGDKAKAAIDEGRRLLTDVMPSGSQSKGGA